MNRGKNPVFGGLGNGIGDRRAVDNQRYGGWRKAEVLRQFFQADGSVAGNWLGAFPGAFPGHPAESRIKLREPASGTIGGLKVVVNAAS